MSDGGKGSAPRPFSVDRETYESNWDRIFKKTGDKSRPSDYQDILSTEDCALSALEKLAQIDEELGLYDDPPPQEGC